MANRVGVSPPFQSGRRRWVGLPDLWTGSVTLGRLIFDGLFAFFSPFGFVFKSWGHEAKEIAMCVRVCAYVYAADLKRCYKLKVTSTIEAKRGNYRYGATRY